MTKVTINYSQNPVQGIHRIGNWYLRDDDTLWILANVEGKAVLIGVCGNFFYFPIDYPGSLGDWVVPNDVWEKVTDYRTGEFTLVNDVVITHS